LVSELDALGDELLADEDSSYLDEAASAPAIPEGVPTDTKNKVVFALKDCSYLTSCSVDSPTENSLMHPGGGAS
jgi:hypothetical protein